MRENEPVAVSSICCLVFQIYAISGTSEHLGDDDRDLRSFLSFGVAGLQLRYANVAYWLAPMFNGTALIIAVSRAGRRGTVSLRRCSRTLSAQAAAAPPQPIDGQGRGLPG